MRKDDWHKKYLTLTASLLAVAGSGTLSAQPTDPTAYWEALKERSVERETEPGGIDDPFVGITTDGKPMPGLFEIRPTGASTASIINAAELFLGTLDAKQLEQVRFAPNDVEWRKWDNRANYYRAGVWFETMTETQRQAAFDLIGASLSARGLKLTKDSMKLNRTLGELNDNDFAKYGEWKYWITMMGEPSSTEPWGWQLDGHHLAINYMVVGDQVVMSPTLWGAEPTIAESGKFKGVEVLSEVTDSGLKLMQSLTPRQQEKATIKVDKDGVNILTQAFSDNVIVPYSGIKASNFSGLQKALLMNVIAHYVDNMREEHARIRMSEVEQHLEDTWFAWIGDTSDDAVFYYRIQSPVILIEFDHERPQGLANLYKHKNAYREHIHSVVRTPNGNDYGTDLLRQHYENHSHGEAGADGKPHWHSD